MPVARVGDKATCPKHQRVATIVSGDITLTFEGQPVARHGDRLSCGCSLIAGKQSRVYVDMGGGGGGADGVWPAAAASDLAPLPVALQAAKEPVCAGLVRPGPAAPVPVCAPARGCARIRRPVAAAVARAVPHPGGWMVAGAGTGQAGRGLAAQ
ncbi:hypothetical protein G6F57_020792 [Rhizopus arrhizus]|nr:hypothetical protein G6F22_017302 [Rhizopus arrhizus]KAG1436156.1 hypothetical protein G6F57_020792 [Rhizopus arrhizus]